MYMLFTSVLESLSCLPFVASVVYPFQSLSCLLVFWKHSVVYPLLPQLFTLCSCLQIGKSHLFTVKHAVDPTVFSEVGN